MAKVLLRKFPGIPWIDIGDIRKGPRVDVGASAEVYGGLWQGTPVAVKRLYADRSQSLEDFFREITVMSKLSHPNIVLLMGIYVDSLGDRFIITEYMERGSVYDMLHPQHKPPRPPPPNVSLSPFRAATADPAVPNYYQDSGQLSPPRVLTILQHTARAISYLHSFRPPILHRDLKSHNILVRETAPYGARWSCLVLTPKCVAVGRGMDRQGGRLWLVANGLTHDHDRRWHTAMVGTRGHSTGSLHRESRCLFICSTP